MANPSDAASAAPETPSAATTVSPSLRNRLQQVFNRGLNCLEKGDYAYAHDLFAQCVSEDPASLVYVQHFRANLAQLHDKGGKKGGMSFPSFGSARGAVSKPMDKGDWRAAFAAGCKALKKAPADTGVLCELADACGTLDCTDTQLYYLRWALDITPADLAINRQAAYVLESIGQFDQAIGCWARVLQQSPNEEEARNAVARLSVEKTIDDGGYNPELLHGAAEVTLAAPKGVAAAAKTGPDGSPVEIAEDEPADPLAGATPEELEAAYRWAIDNEPAGPSHYGRLADLYVKQGRLQDAETLYRKGLEVSGGGDLTLLEKLEETHLVRMQQRAAVAAKRAKQQPDDESAAKLASQTQAECNHAEVDIFTARATREPKNPRLQYELGLRLKRVGKYREAIQPFQASRDEPARRAEANLMLGECFQQISQHQLALRSYDAAIEAIPAADWGDLKKLALYRAGVLALGMGELDAAEQRLTDLASADFAYRDVGKRLDKVAKLRKNA